MPQVMERTVAETTVNSKWRKIPEPDKTLEIAINKQLKILGEEGLDPLVVKHLSSLGFNSVPEILKFLFPKAEDAHDPWSMKGMREMVEAIEDAMINERSITVVGDYDVDGICSTAIAYQALKKIGCKVDYYIPHRIHDGYGIKPSVVEKLKERGTEVILTVDNGIAGHDAVTLAKAYGMTVLITDHHTPGDTLPDADVLINPHQKGCQYPFKLICGGAIAFKLSQALFEYMGYEETEVDAYRQLLAICTVADVMPLVDENRLFVLDGLKRMKKSPSMWIKALMKVMKMDKRSLTETSIGFYIGPALNAPGRLDTAETSLKLLLSQTDLEAITWSNICIDFNKNRQALVDTARKDAELLVRPMDPVKTVCLPVHEGIAGILAGQVREAYDAPAFVFAPAHADNGTEILKGSGRSVPGFSLFLCLKEIAEEHPEWFHSFGGHAGAAGVSIYPAHLEDFIQAANEVFRTTPVPEPVAYYLDEVTEAQFYKLSTVFKSLAPFGQAHVMPRFKVVTTVADTELFGQKKNHLRILSEDGATYTLFRGAMTPVAVGKDASIYVTISRSFFAGREKLDVLVEDIEQ